MMFFAKCLGVLVLLGCCQTSEGYIRDWFKSRNVDTEFLLYTKGSSSAEILNPSDSSTIKDGSFVKGAKTIFLIHGYSDHGKSQWIQDMKDELLKLPETLNVIIVNWKTGANVFYLKAIRNIVWVGDKTVKLISLLIRDGEVLLSDFHLIGHSLGAQLAGHVGRVVGAIGRITALDPAGLGFAKNGESSRLDASDADFVDVIHTDDGEIFELDFGYVPGISVGDADFYPNDGIDQPNCPQPDMSLFKDILMGKIDQFTSDVACSHMRAVLYFTSSINKCTYPAHSCQNNDESLEAVMGYHASPTSRGKFCLETSGTEPFCETTESPLERFLRILDLQ